MRDEAVAFLRSLSDRQRAAAAYDFTDPERYRWQYTPGRRGGVALSEMDETQRGLAMALLEAGLSPEGARTANGIIRLETVLREVEKAAGRPSYQRRDPDHFWFSVFGDPTGTVPWGWRVGGHHLCVHVTVVADRFTVTPLFFGANPARIPHGPDRGVRLLGPEEELARTFLGTLDDSARAQAIVSDQAPSDILTGNAVRAEIAAVPAGLDCSTLDDGPRAALAALLDRYLSRVPSPPAIDPRGVSFVWAGSPQPGQGHYYAVRAGDLLLEYDNTQNDANHVHTVWRDRRRDWGEDLLAAHYHQAHST
jgi:Protein of unknown function (DUF3500)